MSVELLKQPSGMGPAIENYEIYWRKCTPNNALRRLEGLPEVTKDDLEHIKGQIHLKDLEVSAIPEEPAKARRLTTDPLTAILAKYIPDPTAREQAVLEITSTNRSDIK